jgi:hypothetical protein
LLLVIGSGPLILLPAEGESNRAIVERVGMHYNEVGMLVSTTKPGLGARSFMATRMCWPRCIW